MMSQDDRSPKPMKPSTIKKGPLPSNLKRRKQQLEKVPQEFTEEEDDTDFKDSANGDQEEITEEAVR